jgi:hypothetical protein
MEVGVGSDWFKLVTTNYFSSLFIAGVLGN